MMEKADILRCHENYICNTYEEIRYYEHEISSIDEKLSLLYEKEAITFCSEYVSLILNKTLFLIQIEEIKADLLISRARIFFELGLMDEDTRKSIVQGVIDSVVRHNDVEYKLMLIKLAGIADLEADSYADLVNYIYILKKEGTTLKQNVLKKDI